MSFEWHTDEEKGWDRPTSAPGKQRERLAVRAWRSGARLYYRHRRRHRRALLSGLLLFVTVSALGFRALTLRLEAAENARIGEVWAAYSVLLDAVTRDDAELFLTMLTPDRSWRQTQLALFEQNAVFRRDSLGLEWLPETEPATEVELSPDLQQGVVTSTLHYLGYVGSDDRQPVALRHVLRFENDGTQWRLGRQSDDFWGGWMSDDDDQVLVAFSAREEELGTRLAEDLNARIESICAGVGGCPQALRIQLRMERNLNALVEPAHHINGPSGLITIDLPAPSLVGIPADDAAYSALLNGYTRQLAGELLDYFVAENWPVSGAFDEALRQRLLVQLGLAPWPPAQIMASTSFADFEQDILTLCVDGVAEGSSLWRYQSEGAQWTKEFDGWNVTKMAALDGAPGSLFQAQNLRAPDPEPAIAWWRDGRIAAQFDGLYLGDSVPGSPVLTAGTLEGQSFWIWLGNATNCNGQSCAGTVTLDMPTTWSPDGVHTLFRHELEGSRSPPAADSILWLGDGNGSALRRVGEGFYPFWIDYDTFGYLAIAAEPQRADGFNYDVITRKLGGNESSDEYGQVILTTEALKELLPGGDDAQPVGMSVNYLLVHPARPQNIYLVASRFVSYDEGTPQFSLFLFAIDRQSGGATLLIPTDQVQWSSLPQFSRDGRWLAYLTYDPLKGEGAVAVHDLDGNPGHPNSWQHRFTAANDNATPTFQWSQADGKLLLMDQGVMHVVQPGSWTEWQIIPPVSACSQAVWANP